MTFYELRVGSSEQTVGMMDGYSAQIKFDPFYKRWYYDLYKYDELIYAGVALNVDSAPLLFFEGHSLALLDKYGTKDSYEPYDELGKRLALVEIVE